MSKHETHIRRGAHFRLIIAVVILIAVGTLIAWPKYQELKEKQNQLTNLQTEIDIVGATLDSERDIYRVLKEEYAARAATDQKAIAVILPETTSQTEIVREIEDYTNQLANTEFIELKSISFGRTVNNPDIDYVTIPFKINLDATEESLMIFLRHFEYTGNINSDLAQTNRLLDIQDVEFQSNSNSEKKGVVNVNLSVNAYALLPDIK